MRLKISKEADRLEVAAILVKSGYKVCQRKEKRKTTATSKALDYFIEVEEIEGTNSEG